MRLDFNVLWVDDQPDRIKAQIEAIERRMEAQGFLFKPTLCRSIDEVQQSVGNNVFTDEIDLILVDWDLGGGVEGQDAIATTRDAVPYKDVVFYSAMKPAEELRMLASDRQLEGIYCATREDLVEEVIGVFDSLVKKVLDLDHTRGIVMGATSDIDHMVNECLVAIHDKLDEKGQQAMLKAALQRIDERISDLTKRATVLKDSTTMAALFEAHLIFTANDRLRILSRVLKYEIFKDHVAARKAAIAYMQDVVPERNGLGHLVYVPEGKPRAVTTMEGKEISLDETRELRRTILGLRQDFRNLLLALQAAG
jgi:hypothetical protein